jgi:hypothetical protein
MKIYKNAGGDYRAKRADLGSKLFTPRGGEVLKTMEKKSPKRSAYGRIYILAI